MIDYDVRQLQQRILGNLLAVDRVCREHGLHYYIYDGTMLGAIRHGGFIPWDDDLDIAMPREDYETFIAHANEWLPKPYEFVAFELDPTYPLPFGKVQDASTTLIERPHLPYLGGLYIDVFPLDGVPTNNLRRRLHLVRYDLLKKVVYLSYRDPYRHGHGPSSWLPLICRKLVGQKRAQRMTRRLLCKYPFAESSQVCVYDDGFKGVISRDVLGQPTPVMFEGHEVMGVEHPHEYLTHMYGDYLTPPPHDDQRQHKFYYVDFDKPYKTYNQAPSTGEESGSLWSSETDLLVQLLDVCRCYNLRCWVADGTLLGAVRHQGFIPWDNDIDVCMLRDDYDRLLQIGPEAFQSPYFFQTPYTDKRYYHGHAQLRNSDTAAIRPSDAYRPFNQGIFIDIFPLDAVPEDKQLLNTVMHRVRKITRFLKAYDTPILISGRIGLIFRKWKCRWQVWRRGWQNIYREVDDALRSTSSSPHQYVAELSFSGDQFLLDKHIFDDTVMLPFQDIEVPAPKDYDGFLRAVYGDDYMTPRQVSTAHDDMLVDTTRSYVELLPQARRLYRKQQLRKLFKH